MFDVLNNGRNGGAASAAHGRVGIAFAWTERAGPRLQRIASNVRGLEFYQSNKIVVLKLQNAGVALEEHLHLSVAGASLGRIFPSQPHRVADEERVEVDHDDATVVTEARKDAVGDVAGVVAQSARTAVAENHWCLGDVENVAHDLCGDVTEVHEHACETLYTTKECPMMTARTQIVHR